MRDERHYPRLAGGRVEGVERRLPSTVEVEDHEADVPGDAAGQVLGASNGHETAGSSGGPLDARETEEVRVDDEDGRLLLHVGKLNPL